MPLPITAVFADLPDPRRETANKRHALTDILVIATCAVISGCDTWDDIAEYGDTKEDFFRRFLPLANGIPSADTFARVRHGAHTEFDDGHGRHEERSVTVLYHPDGLPEEWVGAKAVVQMCRERVADGVRTLWI